MLAFCRSNFGAVAGEGTALLFNTKDCSLFLCVGEVPRAHDHGKRKKWPRTLREDSFALGKKIHVKASFSD